MQVATRPQKVKWRLPPYTSASLRHMGGTGMEAAQPGHACVCEAFICIVYVHVCIPVCACIYVCIHMYMSA